MTGEHGELAWAADGTRLSGYRLNSHSFLEGLWYSISGAICSEGCAFEVRFGTKDGERRAYLTADYGHDNPGTLVDVELRDGAFAVSRTNVFPPGTVTLSGVVTETTAAGPIPVAGARVVRPGRDSAQSALTDENGSYAISGLFIAYGAVETYRSGYIIGKRIVIVNGDTRLDVTLVRQ